jgi:hypothetical protein
MLMHGDVQYSDVPLSNFVYIMMYLYTVRLPEQHQLKS